MRDGDALAYAQDQDGHGMTCSSHDFLCSSTGEEKKFWWGAHLSWSLLFSLSLSINLYIHMQYTIMKRWQQETREKNIVSWSPLHQIWLPRKKIHISLPVLPVVSFSKHYRLHLDNAASCNFVKFAAIRPNCVSSIAHLTSPELRPLWLHCIRHNQSNWAAHVWQLQG